MEDEEFTVHQVRGDRISKEKLYMIYNVFTSGFKTLGTNYSERLEIQRSILGYIQSKDKLWYFVYSSLGEIVSIIAVLENMLRRSDGTVNPSYTLELQSIATLPDYRGSGFVRALLDSICKNNKSGLWLDVNEDNKAYKIYKKMGFTVYEQIPQEHSEMLREEGHSGRRFRMIRRC
jgi:ribosomal protein S18 acetylase RimI-like enzyme